MSTATTARANEPAREEPRDRTGHSRTNRRLSAAIWIAVAVALVVISVVWILATDLRPSYDPFGWLDWGQQVLAGNFNTYGAPSWKPLTFLFTMPYALAGRDAQMWLWMVTATASALAGSLVAGHLAYDLTGPTAGRPWARWFAALFAGIGLLGLTGYSQLLMISNSDPMIVTLCLAAVDLALHRRPRLAFIAIFLAGLGRPELWAFLGLFGLWHFIKTPRMRWLVALLFIATPAAWFIVPGLTSQSWLHPGDLAQGSFRAIHGNKIIGVFDRLRSLFAVPVQLTILFALGLTVVRRERAWLWVAGAALFWLIVETAFALHGWSAVIRYLVEAGALLVVLAGAALGRVLAWVPPGPRFLRLAPVIPIIALLIGLIPGAKFRLVVLRYEVRVDRKAKLELVRLQRVIRADGGAAAMKSCGQPATLLGYQSELAWVIGENVGSVSFRPGKSIGKGKPVVVFKPHDDGWQVRVFNLAPGTAARCNALKRDTTFGGPNPSPSAKLRQSGG
ncbi:MAG TPA: hypothetical protein VG405_09405 [Solirubrobacteraceae bacterium]|jgi:hypothetical protein|nr:hypothetical protein [Solirubrobacteraceae bacterium]